jgi:hypothetical protein
VVETRVRAGRPLYYCYRSGRLITRARSIQRAIHAAVALLSSYGTIGKGGGCRIPALVAVREGRVALLCSETQVVAKGLRPRLQAAGWELADTVGADLDPESGDVIIPAPMVSVDAAALAELPADRSDGVPPAPGRYPVSVWVAVGGTGPMPETAAARVVALAAGSESLTPASAPTVLQATLAMLRRAIWAVSPTLDSSAIVRTLTQSVP